MKIATWNVNSVRVRVPHIVSWLQEQTPDVLLLQELKTVEEGFPFEAFEDIGYTAAVWGQKTYNGVAILARGSIEDVQKGFPGMDETTSARYIEAVVFGKVRVASIYVPNGQEVGATQYIYKLEWLSALREHMAALAQLSEVCVLGGDYNIAPAAIDVYDPVKWEGRVLFSEPERAAFRALLNIGYHDALRTLTPNASREIFTWWDYRTRGFEVGHGLRIDHLLLSHAAVDVLKDAGVDAGPRALERPSDHAPVWCTLDVA